jgi:hypothetical protein
MFLSFYNGVLVILMLYQRWDDHFMSIEINFFFLKLACKQYSSASDLVLIFLIVFFLIWDGF